MYILLVEKYFRPQKFIGLLVAFFAISFIYSPAKGQKLDPNFTAENVMKTMHRVADWQINDLKSKSHSYRSPHWLNATFYAGLYALGTVPDEERYLKFLYEIGEEFQWETGKDRFYADAYCMGQTYVLMYRKFKEPKMIANFRRQADSVLAKDHSESLKWENKIYLREWAWADALFMAPPGFGYLTAETGDYKYLDGAVSLYWRTKELLYSPKDKLFFRDDRFIDKKEANGKPVFWSRGVGWVLAGIVRFMESMPADYVHRKKFEDLYKAMAKKVASIQQPDGSWHASLLDPDSYPVKEMSGTGFHCYALMWGVNNKMLSEKKYMPVIQKAWRSMISSVNEEGKLGYVQPPGDAADKVTSETTGKYGVGAFLLAGTEIHRYLNNR